MTDLLRHFVKKGVEIKTVDIGSEWAEIDTPASLAKFVLGTKSETLKKLASLVKKAKFCKQRVFTVDTWRTDGDGIIKTLRNDFAPHPVAVRSSALAEDSWKASYAGAFRSILNVDSDDLELFMLCLDSSGPNIPGDPACLDP